MSSLQGVLLYEGGGLDGDRHRGMSTANPSSTGQSSSSRPRHPLPHESFNLRTNFTTAQPTTHVYDDDDKPSPSPILGDYVDHRGLYNTTTSPTPGDFGPTPPTLQAWVVLVSAVVGAGLGVLFFNLHIGPEWLKVVSLPGNLYVRALQCLIVPMVFCVLTIVVAETVSMGRTSIFRLRTLVPFLLSSLLAAAQGTALAYMFQSAFTKHTSQVATAAPPVVTTFNLTMLCANGLVVAAVNNTVACLAPSLVANATTTTTFVAQSQTAAAAVGSAMGQLSLMDQVTGILDLMVTSNIFHSLVDGDLLSIVIFSFPLGYVVAKSTCDVDGRPNVVLVLLRQLRNIFLLLLHGLLTVTPAAVGFLMAAAIAKFDAQGITNVMSQIGTLFAAFLIGVCTHNLVVLPLLVFLTTKSNPFAYMQQLVPAYVFAFSCASSMATLPVVVVCIQRAAVSRTLALITMPFGTPVNMNGAGLYYPLAVVFMACMAGVGDRLDLSRWAIIFVVGWLGSMGTAPVPNAGMVYILTLWKTCFPADPLPTSFAFIVAADFIVDRIATAANVNGNAMVTRILADQVDETFEVLAAQQH
ncbi:Aste57867_17395 [Aphanomyces stellatus]|uniref:Amino acid transporter n=1 Tax=Aphanomyces stellatus TaxID=120398 RepID=A0A485L8F3_9STRA|nr:hypothetical protein As57867_017335 [Aphanomyces stellatus]VFT94151.1 Aste57867_17395 [Aphanomyces stellatus]